jgi:hypothetical protein
MAGNESLTLNRPKYLSDQLWNKVLLNSIYHTSDKSGNINDIDEIHRGTSHYNSSTESRKMQLGNEYNDGIIEPLSNNDTHVPENEYDKYYNYGHTKLTYVGESGTDRRQNHKHRPNIEDSNIDTKIVAKFHHIGYNRYHTTIIRYIEWFVHIQRVMRLLMRNQLNWVNDPIVHKSNAINSNVTEYDSNSKFELSDFE